MRNLSPRLPPLLGARSHPVVALNRRAANARDALLARRSELIAFAETRATTELALKPYGSCVEQLFLETFSPDAPAATDIQRELAQAIKQLTDYRTARPAFELIMQGLAVQSSTTLPSSRTSPAIPVCLGADNRKHPKKSADRYETLFTN